jgi:hypothetical protein
MKSNWQRERILIWGKTYPELSKKHIETVCTAGVTDAGRPLRLYPVPFRYLSEQFEKYQWITANVRKNTDDARPESYNIDCESIECGERVSSTMDEWGKRAAAVFANESWQFETMEMLQQAQKLTGESIGVVYPRQIKKIEIVDRGEAEIRSFDEKFRDIQEGLEAQRAQLTLFEQAIPPEMKTLEFLRARVQITWLCHGATCNGHCMQVLDWEVCELQRKCGNEGALKKLEEITNLNHYALRFFLGNLFLYPQSFMIVGLWYPKRSNLLFH